MSEVLRKNGFIFRIRENDHTPSHVHAYKGKNMVAIDIGDRTTPPRFSKRKRMTRMSDSDAFKALRLVAEQQDYLLRKWREIHG
jgi:Domain of unknown function (DUF4160)